MSQGNTRSLNEIRQETEQTRAALTTTVAELRGTVSDTAADIKDRLRPEAIKAEVSGYIKSRGEQMLQDMTDAARRNPMQAVAIGASVAYPVIRMARAIPLPILMIGAGLFFAGSKTGRELTQNAADFAEDLSDKARARAHDLGDQASQVAADLKDTASDAIERAGQSIKGTAEQLQQTGTGATKAARSGVNDRIRGMQDSTRQAGDAIASRTQDIKDAASNAANLASTTAQQTMSRVSDAMRDAQSRAVDTGRELVDTARLRLADAQQKTTDTLKEQVERNPLLVAGVGLLIGGLIASALPKSEPEENLMGDASDMVKRRAREAANAGFDAAKGVTGDILSSVAQQASAEGLTPDGLAQGADDVRRRLQRVADRAVTTAFDPDQDREHNQQSEGTGGGKQHG